MSIYRELAEAEAASEPVAFCVLINSSGSTPRHSGSKMLVYSGGRIQGTIGGGEVESRVIQEALTALVDGKSRKLSYNMVDPQKGDPGTCGGQVEVFVEPVLPPAEIVIIGAGHVGQKLAHLAHWLGFRVAVSDDRPEFCTPETNPDADRFYPVPMAELPQHMKVTAQTYLVLTTRGTSVDIAGLPALLACETAYIGIIGSKRRWSMTRKALMEAGIPEAKLARIHSPVGLELNAETPEEIAVSILAEILMLKNGGTGAGMKL
jgi:xanthine dehydrogenase accessory factor